MELFARIVVSMFVVGLFSVFCYIYNIMWLSQEKIRDKLRRQGIRGPKPSFFYGNIPEMKRIQSTVEIRSEGGHVARNYALTLFPYFEQWRNDYGPIFMYTTGNIQHLYVSSPDVVKEISQCKSLDLGKPTFLVKEREPLLGKGIIKSNGPSWAHQRKMIAPEFFMDKVKGMVDLMVESTIPLLKSWESIVDREGGVGDIRVDDDLRNLSADVISRTCFGSNYSKGKEIFLKLRALQRALSKPSLLIGIPGLRFLPTKRNREIWRLDKEIRSLILKIVNDRKEGMTTTEKDLLQTILEGAKDGYLKPGMASRFIVDNCKNIYFAGHETTAVTATWSLMLLASHPEWQTCVRDEAANVCSGRLPDASTLHRLRMLTMVIQETLRLFPPSTFVPREVFREMKFGDLDVPKGTNLWISVPMMHRDPNIWGQDVDEFKPERFERGISGACKLPHAYMPFGVGTRTCLGQNFAMVELKVVLCLILSKFTFSLSPKYSHSPAFRMLIEPKHGVNLLMKKV